MLKSVSESWRDMRSFSDDVFFIKLRRKNGVLAPGI